MADYGITQQKVATVAQPEGERFKAPRPVFQAPQNAEHIQPKVKDNTPAPSLAAQAAVSTSEMIQRALLAASEAAKTQVPDTTSSKPRPQKAKVEKVAAPVKVAAPKFGPEDVCDDRTFIKRTVRGDYNSPEMIRLFWANGGEEHMRAGLTLAQAFINLRTEKMRNLRK